MDMKWATATLLLALASATAWAQVNAGDQKPEASVPFNMTTVATFTLPWRMAFLPDGRMLVTEKVGPVWLVTQQGQKTMVANTPVSYTHLRAHETPEHLVCRLLLEKKN